MMDKPKFFDYVRKSDLFKGKLNADQVEGIEAILDATKEAAWPLSWTAYALATAYHETAFTMQPIAEMGGHNYFETNYGVNGKNPKRAILNGNTATGDGAKYKGRGFVQLTWKNNYKKAAIATGLPIDVNPDLMLQIKPALKVMIWGMSGGHFTGKALKDYLGSKGAFQDFVNARRIINGSDKAMEIANYAFKFQTALMLAGA